MDIYEQKLNEIDGHMEMDGGTDEMDGWMDGWTDGWIDAKKHCTIWIDLNKKLIEMDDE